MKRPMLAAFFSVLLLAGAMNLWAFPRSVVVQQSGTDFDIGRFVEANRFDESAPVVLTNHFNRVSVRNLGDPKKSGINFSTELSRIFGIRNVNRDEPIDIRQQEIWSKLSPYLQYSSRAKCAVNRKTQSCRVLLIWNPADHRLNRTFITYRVSNRGFALIDSQIARKMFGWHE